DTTTTPSCSTRGSSPTRCALPSRDAPPRARDETTSLGIALALAAQLRLHEGVEVTVEDRLDVARLVIGTEILDELVRRHDVGADLVAPRVVDPVAAQRVELGPALHAGPLGQLGPQDLHRLGLVLVLAALVLAGDHDAGRQVGQAHRGVRLVDVLPPGTRGPISVDTQVFLVDIHLGG